MKRILIAALLAGALPAIPAGTSRAQLPPSPAQAPASPRVEALLAAMTLEEKAGQMTQLTLTAVAAQGGPSRDSVRIDPAKLREAIVQRHVGSLLNVIGGSLSIEGWHRLIGEV